jgi:hypothetical protein
VDQHGLRVATKRQASADRDVRGSDGLNAKSRELGLHLGGISARFWTRPEEEAWPAAVVTGVPPVEHQLAGNLKRPPRVER